MVAISASGAAAWEREKERVRRWRAKRSAAGRDIGSMPPIADPELRRQCRHDLQLFAIRFFPESFKKPFSRDHRAVIAQMQRAILDGGKFALAMPRGSGKTTLSEVAALWAILYGHHHYVTLVGATADAAKDMLESIKTELSTNERLAANFPEACYPIAKLEGLNNRANGQRYLGEPTRIKNSKYQLVLPTIPGSPSSGAILRAVGITGTIRGKKHKDAKGANLRPTLVIVDDPQTDKSARSFDQCNKREETIKGSIAGLVGPGEKLAVIMPCTIICEGDLAARFLDRERHGDWNGITTKTLYKFPDNMELWGEYWEERSAGMRAGDGGKRGNAFYKRNRKAMDAGAQVAWEERYRDDELSALQSAMNLYLADRWSFFAEYQNEPLNRNAAAEVNICTAAEIADKVNQTPRGTVPAGMTILSAFIDVSQNVLWWKVCAWTKDFGGAVVDYGTWPDQNRPYFTLQDLRITIGETLPHIVDPEALIYTAVQSCVTELTAREFVRDDGIVMRLPLVMIDANWGEMTDTVYRACRQHPMSALLLPSHGRGVKATQKPFSQFQKKEGETIGQEWIRRGNTRRAMGHVLIDTNYWKSFVHARLAVPMGGRGCLSLFGKKAQEHRMIADHYVAEKPTRVTANGRTITEWAELPSHPDNHGLDELVGCAVGASIQGCSLLAHTAPPKEPLKPRPTKVSKSLF